ncbi:hypothetical protein B6S12_06920 [Helicobacter valdiviensis]|uniref:Lipoprotein n=1 Tax=Helicobacter valdiviensis TaxID=1458358 RepID=A0A2W6PMB2_9HELI|nr:hypothetical protein [Helicobacter valdiviensis]PZT47813.1 hypothetical protein B6S12_06920 [Helicobacter valdiviensis]
MKSILTSFLLSFCLFFISGCANPPLANPNLNYPQILYQKDKDTSIIPIGFSQTFTNRFKILYEKTPNPNLKTIEFYFTHYYNEAQGDDSPTASFSFTPRYLLRANVIINGDIKLHKDIELPVIAFNPPYSQIFDGIIQEALKLP